MAQLTLVYDSDFSQLIIKANSNFDELYNIPAAGPDWESDTAKTPSSGLNTWAHGLAGVPKAVSVWAVCTSAANGYTVGSIAQIANSGYTTDVNGYPEYSHQVWSDSDNVYLYYTGVAPFSRASSKGTVSTGTASSSFELWANASL